MKTCYDLEIKWFTAENSSPKRDNARAKEKPIKSPIINQIN